MDPSQSYAWDGWWAAGLGGAYLVTMAYLAAFGFVAVVRGVRSAFTALIGPTR
jgi:hypothetical protein